MEEIYRGNTAVLKVDLGHGRIRKMVVDLDTGEIIEAWQEAGSAEMFPRGCGAVIRDVFLSREKYPGGAEKVFVCTPTGGTEKGVYFEKMFTRDEARFGVRKGTGKGRGRTRGERGKITIRVEKMQEFEDLGEAALGFLLRLARLARYDTGVISGRKGALRVEDLVPALGIPRATLYRRFSVLEEAGILEKTPEGYRVNREYIRKE